MSRSSVSVIPATQYPTWLPLSVRTTPPQRAMQVVKILKTHAQRKCARHRSSKILPSVRPLSPTKLSVVGQSKGPDGHLDARFLRKSDQTDA